MNKSHYVERCILLFIPWAIASFIERDPLFSYFIAWTGSFLIFIVTFTGGIIPLPRDRSFANQIMRPIFIVQIIFAGYTGCTSIFYLLSLYGYVNFLPGPNIFLDVAKLELVAQCQRYYVLGHAAMVTGMIVMLRYPGKPRYQLSQPLSNLLFYATIYSAPLAVLFLKLPGFSQFANQFSSLSFMASALGLAFAIVDHHRRNIFVCAIFYALNTFSALSSGFKEPVILSVLVLGIFLYPAYKKIVLLVFTPILILLFFVLPTYVGVIRQNNWNGEATLEQAQSQAIDAALNKEDVVDGTTWDFFVHRLSEIEMFTGFVESTPRSIPFYKYKLLEQSIDALIPRIFWSGKASTENVVMQRVYDAGIVDSRSNVSAKPAFIVDAYLSGGGFGVLIFLFLYGLAAQFIAQKAEMLFGGYILGTALVFSGLFQIFWRGLSFEFFLNNIFWSYLSMLIISSVLVKTGVFLKNE